MSDPITFPSLLPYLKVQAGLALDFSLIAEDPVDLSKRPCPFTVLSDADPFANVLEARFATATGDTIKDVSVLIEKDRFFLAENAVFPVSNPDVEAVWQRAFSIYRKDSNSGLLCLSPQVDQDGALARLAPLFYCTLKSLFFHPPCPHCGALLGLCTDDDRLIASGLFSYSSSLKRYLTCNSPGCPGASDFYVYELTRSEIPAVKNHLDLIRAYSKLPEALDSDPGFPCTRCPSVMLCFGPKQTATPTITPFSFYPFYMLIFDSVSVSALDFLALLSGAAPREVVDGLRRRQEHGRANRVERLHKNNGRRLFSQEGERLFLEVVYLKLSLLAEVIRSMPGRDNFLHPAFRSSLERIWVNLADQSAFLPSFWTFSVHPLDLYCSSSEDGCDADTMSRPDLYSLALMWFYAFLVNERQGFAEILVDIRKLINKTVTEELLQEAIRRSDRASVFSFANTFWHPSEASVTLTEPSLRIWEKCMESGWSLLKSAVRGSDDRSREDLLNDLEILRQEIYAQLFISPTAVAAGAQTPSIDDAVVYRTLHDIIAKWSSRAENGKPPAAGGPARPEEEEETVETIILTSQVRQEKPTARPLAVEDDLEKTTVISVAHAAKAPQQVATEKESVDDALEKTLVIRTGRKTDASPEENNRLVENAKRVSEEDMEATVIFPLSDQDKLRRNK